MDLKEIIKEYFCKNQIDSSLKQSEIYVCRADGIPLYGSDEKHSDEIGALVAGVWQAAEVMYQRFASENIDENEFRFNFDTSSSGVVIFPIKIDAERFFLSMIFNDVTNPGRLKSLARNCANSLTDYISQTYNSNQQISSDDSIFNGLTDGEIDKAFAFAETN